MAEALNSDKIKRSQLSKQIKLLRETLECNNETIIVPFSAETMQGRDDIWDFIDQVIENEK